MESNIIRLSGAALCGLCLAGSLAFAGDTAFTYQGRLNESGQPANGSYDIVFSLFPTNSGGTQISSRITNSSILVSTGLFTTTVDFGSTAFNGQSCWLQLEARKYDANAATNGGGPLTTLLPRQAVLPAPYAIHSSICDTASIATSASAVLNGVYTTNTYDNPSWITSLSGSKISGNITGTAAGFSGSLAGDVTGSQSATAIASAAVTTAKIADGAVTSAKIAAGAVGNSQIAAGAVTEGKIAASGVLITNLNADMLDGLHAASFAQKGTGPESKNVGVCNTTGTAAAWDSTTGAWTQIALGGSSSGLIGSGGNILFANNSGKAAVWSYTSKTWIQVALEGGFGGIAASKANFAVMNNAGKAAVWSNSSLTWTQMNLGSSFGGIAASGGNFVVANSLGTAAAWNDTTKTWATVSIGGAFGSLGSSGGNFILANNNGTAAAWNHTSGTWTNVALGGATGYVTGSDDW